MFGNTRKRLVFSLSSLTFTLLLMLVLATMASAGGPIVHRVSVGGPDLCDHFGLRPGCDANFSLSAREYADGRVSGQYTDQFGGGFGGFHAVIDCLVVDGNEAWVSGMVTNGVVHLPDGDVDLTGQGVSTRLVDNGTSANDPADQISFSFFSDFDADLFETCTAQPDYELLIVPRGQVRVD